MTNIRFFVEGNTDDLFLKLVFDKLEVFGKKDIQVLNGVANFSSNGLDTFIQQSQSNDKSHMVLIIDNDEDPSKNKQDIETYLINNNIIFNNDVCLRHDDKIEVTMAETGNTFYIWLWTFPGKDKVGAYEKLLWDNIDHDDYNKKYMDIVKAFSDEIEKHRKEINKDYGFNTNQRYKLYLSCFILSHHKNTTDNFNPFEVYKSNDECKFYGEVIKELKDYEDFIRKINDCYILQN